MTRDKRKWAARDNSTTAATMSDSEQPTQDVGAEASGEDAPPPAAGDGEAGSDAGSDVDNSALFGGSDSDDDDDGDAAAPGASGETGDAADGEDAVGAGGGGSDDDEKLFGSDSDDDAAGAGSGSGSGSGSGAGAGAVVVDSDGNSDDGPNLVELPPPSGPRPLENPVNVRVLGEEVVPRPPEGALVQTVRLPSIVGIAPRHFDPECVVLRRCCVEQATVAVILTPHCCLAACAQYLGRGSGESSARKGGQRRCGDAYSLEVQAKRGRLHRTRC